MAELSDCQRNVGIPGHGQRICSQYIVYSDTEEVKFSTKVVKFSQNDFDLFVGSMKVEEILKIAMIPDLKFDMNPEDFSQYTYEQITNLPSIPSRWQRPLNLRRERDIRNYFFTPGLAGRNVKSVIPGAIILGKDVTLP